MSVDYNIYIHDKTGGQNKPTVPRSDGGNNTAAKSDSEEGGAAQESLIKSASKTKFGKIAIAAYAAVKVTDKVVGTITPFVTRETGDYRFSVAYGNVKQAINNIMNPIGTVLNYLGYSQEIRLYNQKQEQQRLLIGDSFINSVSRKV